ncbi:MAG: FMN-binding negative transcriptional regulator [Pseudobacteriovorax sp.]|nr:FMN-binding negative transcriptional regulator [Pseudobacteriovorax sp.]
MYIPKHFIMSDVQEIKELILNYPLAQIFYQVDGQLQCEAIPTIVDWKSGDLGCIEGHISRSNPLAEQGAIDVLATYRGRSYYVSPSLYRRKAIDGKVVPTWNFEVLQISGTFTVVESSDWLMQHLETFTRQMEKDQENPWSVSDAPSQFTTQIMKGITGFKIQIHDIQAKKKMSQNRSEDDQKRIFDAHH